MKEDPIFLLDERLRARSSEPSPRMLIGMRAYQLSFVDQLAELIDNSFGPAAGDADYVKIIISRDSIAIADNGRGISDLNLMFRIGESQSRLSESDIGKYGWGAKNACVWLADTTEITTITRLNNILYKITAVMRWGALAKAAEKSPNVPWWPPEFSHPQAIKNPSTNTYTIIFLKGLLRKGLRLETLVKELGTRYLMAFKRGKRLIIEDNRNPDSNKWVSVEVNPEQPSGLDCVQTIEDARVNGKRYDGEVGILLEDVREQDRGLKIYFAYRQICTWRTLCGKSIPGRISGSIFLSGSWKNNLSLNKLQLDNAEDLEADLLARCKDVFYLAEQHAEDMFIEDLNLSLSSLLTAGLAANPDGEERIKRIHTDTPLGPNPTPNPCPPTDASSPGDQPASKDGKVNKPYLHVKTMKMGLEGDVGYVAEDDSGITVVLNKESPLMDKAYKEQQSVGKARTASFLMLIGHMLAAHISTMDGGRDRARKLIGSKRVEEAKNDRALMNAILTWWSAVVTKPHWDKTVEVGD